MAKSIYVHIPFCKRKCLYCDFYSVVYDPGEAGRYIDVLCGQIESLEGLFDTLYIGGGTPTSLERDLLERLVRSLRQKASETAEFTIEANPESFDPGRASLLRGLGVNRISIGLQSLDDRKLKKLGRVHNAAKGIDAVKAAARNGFKDISADLIFGVWGEGPADWKEELEAAAALPVTHVSAYSLSYEKLTPLFDAVRNKSVTPLGDEIVAGMYETAIDTLSLRGLKQYEISNFAKEGFRCRHNLSYWENNPYIGLGASAVSYIDGVRSKNMSDIGEYIRTVECGKPLAESSEKLPPVRRARETAAVKIRTKDGIDFGWFRGKTGFDFMELEGKAVAKLVADGLVRIRREGGAEAGIVLKRKGFLFCDTVSSALL